MPVQELQNLAVGSRLELPAPNLEGTMPLEQALLKRRSVRAFQPEGEISLPELAQILWSAQGVTEPRYGFRTAPSAGATFPLEILAVMREGIFQYLPSEHAVRKFSEKDAREDLARAALGQWFIAEAPLTVAICAVPERTTARYGSRGIRYIHFEAGHVAQNIHLQAVALGLGSVAVGAFDDEAVSQALELPSELKPLYLITVGRPR